MPFSYAQYTGNGSTTTFPVPFPYLLKAHVKVYIGFNIVDGTFSSQLVDGTDYSWTSGTQIQTVAAPSAGQTLTIVRQTPNNQLIVQWQDGSNLIAEDLISSDLQNLYVVQEQQDRNDGGAAAAVAAETAANTATAAATAATTAANTATASANAATTSANAATAAAAASTTASNAATATANQASADAAAAVATANTAASNASTALSTANAASSAASSAVTTATAAATDASTALSTANTAATNASTALSTANTAATNASTALSTANAAASNASAAVSTANAASSTASTAASNASAAVATANSAAAAVSSAVFYTPVANLTALGGLTPADDDYYELQDSTGAESSPSITGIPGGLTGASGITMRLRYDSPPGEYVFLGYYANDSETRYAKLTDPRLTDTRTPTDGSVTNAKVASGAAIDPAKIAGTAVVTSDARLSDTRTPTDGSVTNAKVASGAAIDPAKIAGTAVVTSDARLSDTRTPTDGSVTNAKVASGAAIDPAKIAGTAVVTSDARLSDTRTPTDGSVTNAKVASGAAIDPAKIAGTAVVTSDARLSDTRTPTDGSVTNAKVASGAAIDPAKIAGTAVVTSDARLSDTRTPTDGSVTNAKVASGAAIDGSKINPDFGSQNVVTTGTTSAANILYNRRPALHRGSLFYKTAATTISIVAGSVLNGRLYASATAVTMPSHTNNTDYAIWQHPTTGALVGDASFTTAPSAAVGGSIVGGYHYIPSGRPTAVNNGSPTGAAEILEFSIWDLTWRPACPDPRGMACIEGGFWGDLYLVGATSYAGSTFSAVPSSRIGLTIADGSSPPLVPAQYGGNGSTAYPNGKWYVFSELARSFGKRLPTSDEFSAGAFGAPEASSRGTDPGTVQWERVSKFGWAQATGTLWQWARETCTAENPTAWQTGVTEGRGDVYGATTRALLLGGDWSFTSGSGSRCAFWGDSPWYSSYFLGARFVAGHLVLG